MNIIEQCNYRNKCPICKKDTVILYIDDRSKNFCSIIDDNLIMRCAPKYKRNSIESIINFKSDNTYNFNGFLPAENFTIFVNCPKCSVNNLSYPHRLNVSNINSIGKNVFAYSIKIYTYADYTFHCEINAETIKMVDKNNFYHFNVDLLNNKSNVCYGKLNGRSDQIFSLDLNYKLDLSKITDVDILKSKMELYNTFS